jgi:hypothetical protein
MADIATIGAFLSSLRTATEIAKAVKDLDLTLEKAELKLKMADLLGSLADARIAAAELQELLQEKEKEIERLNEAVRLKGEVVKSGAAYFLKDANGKPSGDPFCIHCWDAKKELFHLTTNVQDNWVCPHCRNIFTNYSVILPRQ